MPAPVPSELMIGKSLSLVRTLSMRVFSTLSILPHSGRMAWKTPVAALLGAAAGRVALHDVELALRRVVLASSRRACPGRPEFSSRPFLRVSSRALRAASRALAAMIDLSRILLHDVGVLVEERATAGRRPALSTMPFTSLLPSLRLGLALELRLGHLDRDDRGQALAHVVAAQVLLELLREVELLEVVVEGPGEGALEPDEVRAALAGVDVVGEGEDGLGVAVVVLQRRPRRDVVALAVEVHGLRVDQRPCSCSGTR